MRIAMWSGPRNLSTAMMYAFGNRADCAVMDEPFYGPFLAQSGADHPMRDQILAAHETDPQAVDLACRADGTPHLYMKHMPHHMLEGFPMGWAEGCVHVHLIRHPARVIASYLQKRDTLTLQDIGYPQQWEVYQQLGGAVIDGTEIRADPDRLLRLFEDGIWAQHWYNAVHQSTGFAGAEGPLPEIPAAFQRLLDQALPFYEKMNALALR